jgi:hypothetical protein
MSAIAVALLLASTQVGAADRNALDAATRAIYAPYRREGTPIPWERDIWSREIQHLITHWQSVLPPDEPDAMNDGDWLCQCQDWDSRKFRMTITGRKLLETGVAEVTVNIVLFDNAEPRDARLVFRREQGRWMLDDMVTGEYPDGVKASLRQTILDDEELQRARQ